MNTLAVTQHISSQANWPLHSVAQTLALEYQSQALLPANTLMQRAGLATAQLAMAVAPHARTVWIACGPGNNGGDGLEAAVHLQARGKQPIVTWLGSEAKAPEDTLRAWQRAKAAGVTFAEQPPQQFELVIDALLGIGAQRAPEGLMAQWLGVIQANTGPVLCVDIPTGLLADTGEWLGATQPHRTTANTRTHRHNHRHTLSLLTLKPGLFTADGQDAAGQVWFNDLGVKPSPTPAAWLQQHGAAPIDRPHNSHKGSFGDVSVLGGAPGMAGAAMLAGLAALHGGAGRVLVGLMDEAAHPTVTAAHPALMVRRPSELNLDTSTVVCGCGAGDGIHAVLHQALSTSKQLVLDADALNAIARDTSLQTLLKKRHARQKPTVLTPHPLEAARLLNCTTKDVQQNRVHAAQQLADTFQCVVVLKGSGSIIASPQCTPVINGSGNALLATAGTGDVLAGLVGAYIARHDDVFKATCQAVFAHGHAADAWPSVGPALDAASLAASVR
ncbi:NAD(P)H-hydrate dehydratase [Limnohabitans sp.]|uniref:NAD(P)H-hydrate dehydratase n=1 Tax=Limnohabitans sp. TaxID=1907725 RepID=UPI00286F51EA|nr:NAD(P)H-hydrate dehydratase [Limnohabitans sp.]